MSTTQDRPQRLKVVQWATGGVGRAAMEGVLRHPELELVGCWVSSDAKDGKDVGEILGVDPIGVSATQDVDALLALDADAVVYSPLVPDESVVCRILASGKNVVTPVGWVYPDPAKTGALEDACREAASAEFTREDFEEASQSFALMVRERILPGPPRRLGAAQPIGQPDLGRRCLVSHRCSCCGQGLLLLR